MATQSGGFKQGSRAITGLFTGDSQDFAGYSEVSMHYDISNIDANTAIVMKIYHRPTDGHKLIELIDFASQAAVTSLHTYVTAFSRHIVPVINIVGSGVATTVNFDIHFTVK